MSTRLAYIISAYQRPEQLIRLIRRLSGPATFFFVHVDRKTDARTYHAMVAGLGGLPNVCFLRRHRCDWGGFGHVAATLEGIGEIVRSGIPFDYAILLTGQDYPIKPNRQIDDYFEANNGKAFLEFFPLPTAIWENRGVVGGLDRIEAWHWRVGRRHVRFPPSGRWPIRRNFPAGFRPFGGSSYWCLPQECIEYVHELTTENPAFTRFFQRVDVPDEIFFQTIVLNSPFRERAVNDNLRYIDWKDPCGGSPGILRVGDFEKLLASPKLFARKFDDQIDAGILELIDQQILSR